MQHVKNIKKYFGVSQKIEGLRQRTRKYWVSLGCNSVSQIVDKRFDCVNVKKENYSASE